MISPEKHHEIAALIKEGLALAVIGQRTGAAHTTIRSIRRELGGVARGDRTTIQDAFRARTERGADGHLRWTGPVVNGMAAFTFEGRKHSAHRVAFQMHYGRQPQGPARASCNVPGCVAPACIEDTVTRTKARADLARAQGRRHTRTHCGNGHAYRWHGRYRRNGERYCNACRNQDSQQAAA